MGGGGGNSVANGDACIKEGLDVPRLYEVNMDSIRASVPMAGSIAGNPLDTLRIFQDAAYLGYPAFEDEAGGQSDEFLETA